MSKSSDIAFRLIALQKRLLSKPRLNELMSQAQQQGLSLEALLLETGDLGQEDLNRILRTRRRHGRACDACSKTTYMLPGQNERNTPCEHCRGRLVPGSGKSSGTHKAISGRPIQRPKRPTPARTLRDPELDRPEPEPEVEHAPVQPVTAGNATIREELDFADAADEAEVPDHAFRTTDSPYVGGGSPSDGFATTDSPYVGGGRPVLPAGQSLGPVESGLPFAGDGFATTDSPYVGGGRPVLPAGQSLGPVESGLPFAGDGFATTDSPYVGGGRPVLPAGQSLGPVESGLPFAGDGFATTDTPFVTPRVHEQPAAGGLPFKGDVGPPQHERLATGGLPFNSDAFATTDSPYVKSDEPQDPSFRTTDSPYVKSDEPQDPSFRTTDSPYVKSDEPQDPSFRTTDSPYVDPRRGPGEPPGRPRRGHPDPDPAAVSTTPGVGVPEQSDERARNLRLAGAGFGYEPEPEPTPEPETESEPDAPEAGDARFAPPADDARFAPPAHQVEAQLPLGVVAAAPRIEVPPLRHEILRILFLPARNWESMLLIVFGAALMLPRRLVPVIVVALLVLLLFTYPATYLIRCTRYAFLGKDTLPDWPEFDIGELFGNGFRLFSVQVAAFIPLLLIVAVLVTTKTAGFGSHRRTGNALKSIGTKAHLAAPKKPYIPPGTDCSDATFVNLKDGGEVRLDEGRWTVVGLLGRDTADDTGIDQAMVDMPTGGFGVVIMHGWQPYDLDRIGLTFPKVRVLGAYADPSEKVIRQKYPFLDPDRNGTAEEEPVEEPEVEDDPDGVEGAGLRDHRKDAVKDLHRAMDVAAVQGQISSGGRSRGITKGVDANPFHTLELVKTHTLEFPGALKDVRRLPCVYVIDPQGKIAREYATGVCDEKLYADLQSLMLGGDGDTYAKSLPAHVIANAAQPDPTLKAGLYGFMFLLFVIGLVVYPICYLLMVAFDSPTTAFLYPVGARAISKALPDYMALVLILVLLQGGAIGFMRVLGPRLELLMPGHVGPLVIDFFGFFLFFYASVVGSYAIGRWYYANEDAIGWFSRSDIGGVIETDRDVPPPNSANPWG